MKKILLIFLLFLSLTAAKAQDKIITITHDTIQCRIVSINAARITYEQQSSDNHIVGKTISTAKILQYHHVGNPDDLGDGNEPRWLFSLQGGLAHSLIDYSDYKYFLINNNNSVSETNDYFGKLENGIHVNASLHYLVTSRFGIGFDYNFFHAASKGEFVTKNTGQSNVPLYAKMELDERLYTQFAGASLLFQQFADKNRRIKIKETISPGIVLFRNESRDNQYIIYWGDRNYYSGQPNQYYNQINSITHSNTFGAKGSLSLEYSLTTQLSAGLAGNFIWADIDKVTVKYALSENKDKKLENPINISHIDYGFIVRFNF